MKTALLVIDVQQFLCSGQWACFDIDAVVDRINALAARPPDSPIAHGTPDWQLASRLEAQPGDIRVRKTTPDSFLRTDLAARAGGADRVRDLSRYLRVH